MPRSRYLAFRIIFLGANIFVEPSHADVSAPTAVTLPSPGYVFALSEEARTVAIAYPELGVVRLYPKLLSDGVLGDAKELKIVGLPSGLAHRQLEGRGVYVLLTSDDRTIRILDEKTFDVVGEVVLKDGRPVDLAVPTDAASPHAYYLLLADRGYDEGRIGRVDLVKRRDEGVAETNDGVGDIAVSADGRIVYGRRPGVSPSGYRAWRFSDPTSADAPPQARMLASRHEDAQPYVPDPFNAMVASGKALWTGDLSKGMSTLGEPVRAFMRTRPVCFGVAEDGTIVAFSTNTYQRIAALAPPVEQAVEPVAPAHPQGKPGSTTAPRRPQPPAPPQPPRRPAGSQEKRFLKFGNSQRPYEWFVGVDERHGTLVAARETKLIVAPLGAMKLPEEPMLFVQLTGDAEGQIGRPMTRKIVKADPAAVVTLAPGAPEGMAIEKEQITWTPAPAQVGTHRVSLRVKAGTMERLQEMTLLVRRPSVALPFVPDVVAISPDGKRAVAVAYAGDARSRRRPGGGDGQGATSRLVSLDLDKQTILADRVLPFTANEAVAVSADMVYLAAQGSDALYALSLTDLKDVRRIFTAQQQLRRLSVFGDVLSAYGYGGGSDGRAVRYRLPNLQPIDPPTDRTAHHHVQPWPFPEPVGDGWLVNGVVVGPDGKPRLLVQPSDILDLTSSQQVVRKINGVNAFDTRSGPTVTTWGVTARGQLQRMTGQTVAQLQGIEHLVLNDMPVLVSLTHDRVEAPREAGASRGSFVRGELVLRDLVAGQIRQTITLFNEPPPMENSSQQQRPKLAATPGQIIAAVGDRVFVIATKEIDKAKFPEPVHFEATQETFILPHDRPLRLACKASGGKGALTFAPANDMPGIRVDEKTGVMTIDPAPFLARAGEFIQQVASNRGGLQQASTQPSAVDAVLRNLGAAARARFKELTGQEPSGYPVAVPADVLARDEEQQTAVLNRVVLLDVPFDVVAQRIERQLAEMRQQQEQRRRQEEQLRAAHQQRQQGGTSDSDAQRRIAELERRVAELEGQNKLLRELLGQQQRPATQSQ